MDMMTKGIYTTKRDGGVIYSYEASWIVMPNGSATWSSKVYRDGQYVGKPDGHILNTKGITDMAPYIRALVEASIEGRVGIQ